MTSLAKKVAALTLSAALSTGALANDEADTINKDNTHNTLQSAQNNKQQVGVAVKTDVENQNTASVNGVSGGRADASVEQEVVANGGAGGVGHGGTGEAEANAELNNSGNATLTGSGNSKNENENRNNNDNQNQNRNENETNSNAELNNSGNSTVESETSSEASANNTNSGNSSSQSAGGNSDAKGGNVNFQSHYQGAAATHAPSITVADAEGCADKFGLSVAHGDVSGSYLSVGLGFTPGRGVDIRGTDNQVIGVRAYREMTDGKAQAKATKHLGETGREVLNCVIGIQEEFDANVALRKAINENDNDTQVKVAAIESFTHISVAQIEANSKVQDKTLSHICNLEVVKIKTGEHTEKVVANTLALRPHEEVRPHIQGEQLDVSHPGCASALKKANESSKKINGQVEGLLNSVGFDLNMK